MDGLKNVVVANWGSYLLQRIQEYYRDNMYCDLTLQFADGSSLGVHRLILWTCTDYFCLGERFYETIDNVLSMPSHLEPAMVRIIINFMYTGVAEFDVSFHYKLLQTCKEINCILLAQLLESCSPTLNSQKTNSDGNGSKKVFAFQFHSNEKPLGTNILNPEVNTNPANGSITPVTTDSNSKLNEGFIEQQMADVNCTDNYPDTLDDSSSSNMVQLRIGNGTASYVTNNSGEVSQSKVLQSGGDADSKQTQNIGEPLYLSRKEAAVSKKSYVYAPSKEMPTLITNANEPEKLQHAKVMLDLLKKDPNLIKGTKDITIKILPTQKQECTEDLPQSPELKTIDEDPDTTNQKDLETMPAAPTPAPVENPSDSPNDLKTTEIPNSKAKRAARLRLRKKRKKFRTIRKLIALGAENTAGPWYCMRCGVKKRPKKFPSYRKFREHLVEVHKEDIDPNICQYCGWRSVNKTGMLLHMKLQHKGECKAFEEALKTAASQQK